MKIKTIFLILIVGLAIRLILSPFGTLSLDQNTFIAWSNNLIQGGFKNFYSGWSDYLPGYLYVLWLLGKIKAVLPIPEFLLYKLPAISADVITGYLIYKIVEKFKDNKWALITSSFYLFNPAVLANSTFWGQVDSLTILFSLLSIYLLSFSYELSAVLLSLGTLIKPQAAFIAPLILFIAIKEKWPIHKFIIYVLISLLIFIILFIPFADKNLFLFILERLQLSMSQYPYTSINAFNFWGLFGLWRSDSLINQLLGLITTGVVSLVMIIKVWKRNEMKYLSMVIIFLSSFFFLTRIHERHFLPALIPLIISAGLNPALLIPYVGFSLTYVANLLYSYNWITFNFMSIFPPAIIKIIILINLFLLALSFYLIIKDKMPEFFDRVKNFLIKKKKVLVKKEIPFPSMNFSSGKLKIFLIIVLLFAFVTRVYQLQNPGKEYFDEVYHAFTARQILHNNSKAWEWWNTPPEGFAYEWTHPPLAKLGMVLGMLIFGENSFGWRIPGALLGVGSVFLIYLIAKEIFKDELTGILSAAVFSLDGLDLVISRIGMNDSYFLFFALLSIYFFLKEKDFFSAAAFGLSLSSKWSALWAIPILFVLLLKRKEKFRLSNILFLVLPPAIYLSTYLPMFLTGHGLDIFWGMQKQMWWYHTGLKATHAYTSPWWNWPLMIRPIYLYTSNEVGGDFFAFKKLLLENWSKSFTFPWEGILNSWKRGIFTPEWSNYKFFVGYGEAIASTIAWLLVPLAFFKKSKVKLSYAIYYFLGVILFTSTGFILSAPRYLLSLPPFFIILAKILNNKIIFFIWIVSFLILLFYLSTLFATGQWAF